MKPIVHEEYGSPDKPALREVDRPAVGADGGSEWWEYQNTVSGRESGGILAFDKARNRTYRSHSTKEGCVK